MIATKLFPRSIKSKNPNYSFEGDPNEEYILELSNAENPKVWVTITGSIPELKEALGDVMAPHTLVIRGKLE